MKTAVTITTVNKPIVIDSFIKNIQKNDHKNVEIIIVGDKKTPSGVGDYCLKLSKNYSIPVRYLDIPFQEDYLNKFKKLKEYLPFNSYSRRNIGDLLAYEEGFSTIIRVDDDNYPTNDDFIGMHDILGQKVEVNVLKSDSGWHNICEELADEDSIPFYPRGYPYSKRWIASRFEKNKKEVDVVLNEGLWLGDPDVDAITRLCKPINAVQYKCTFGDNFALEKGTWCPINAQNTSYLRKIIPASFVPPNIGRYDDIWSGYLLRKISDHLNHYITYGSPLLLQKRNIHNLWDDLEKEINGNLFTNHLIEVMNSIDLSGSTYVDCYYELATKLDENLTENRRVFDGVVKGMKIWVDSINKIS